MLAQLAQPRSNGRGNQEQRACGGSWVGLCVVTLRTDPIGKGIGDPGSARVLRPNLAHADAIGFIRRNFFQSFVVGSESKDNDPRLVDRVSLEDVQRVHWRNAHPASLVRQREFACFRRELFGRDIPSFRCDWNQLRMGVCRDEDLSRSRAFSGAGARHPLQITIRMLIRGMPEEGRRPADLGFPEPIDRISRDLEESKRLRPWLVAATPGTPGIC